MAQTEFNVGEIANDGTGDALRDAFIAQQNMNTDLYTNKVDKIFGKELSSNDFTDANVVKLGGIEDGAEVNVQADCLEDDPTSDAYIKNFPTQLFSSIGYFHYTDTATQTTPLTILPDTNKKLTNDGLGAQTNLTQAPYGISTLFNTTTNEFDFSQLSIGDTLDLRVDLLLTTTSANQHYLVFLRVGEGSVAQYDLPILNGQIKSISSDNRIIGNEPFSIDYQEHIDNPATLYILSDDDGSVKVNGWFTSIIRKSVNIVAIPDDFVPLAGTISGSPITGDLEFYNTADDTNSFIKYYTSLGDFIFGNDSNYVSKNGFYVDDGTYVNSLQIGNIADKFLAESNNPDFKGFSGSADFSPNITELDYPQKIYVDNEVDKKQSPYPFSHITLKRSIIQSGIWDASIREIGNAVTLDDGRILVCYTGTTLPYTEGTTEYVGLAVSTDGGLTFTKVGTDGKIITTNSEDPYMIINPINGLLHLYCERKSTTPSFHDGIELFTADVSDLTDWTSLGLVLTTSASTWETRDVSSPSVLYNSGTFYMYYEARGLSVNTGGLVCLATSTDGITFTKSASNPLVYGTDWDSVNPTSEWFTHLVPDDVKKIGDKIYLSTHCYNSKEFVGGLFETTDFVTFKDCLNTWVSVSNNNDSLGSGLMFYKNNGALSLSNNEIFISEVGTTPYSKSIHTFRSSATGATSIKSANKSETITLSITANTSIVMAKQYVSGVGVVKTINNPTNFMATLTFTDALINGSSSAYYILPKQTVVFYCTALNEWNSYIVQKENYGFLNLTDTTPLTGTTTNTQIYPHIIPANSLKDLTLIDLNAWFEKVGTAGTFTVRCYLNASPTPIIVATSAAANRTGTQLIKKLRLKSGNIISKQGGWIDGEETQVAVSTPFDPTIDNELKVFIQLSNSGDSVKMTGFSLETIKVI